ncbi:ABI3 protein, partial [Leiothrix lutea]|nr:ABI3 protein [Leiothrix lutea]
QAGDKRKALEETMALSTQSLASVTYQVSSLARAFLRLLELQAAQLRRLEADVTCLAQVRPSRGVLGSGCHLPGTEPHRTFPTPQNPTGGVQSPTEASPLQKSPMGRGVTSPCPCPPQDTSTQLSRTGTLARKSTKSCSAAPAGTVGRGSRVPEPVQPPVVPQGKLLGPPGSSEPETPSSTGAPAAPGEGIPAPPPLPGPPGLALSPAGPPPPPGPPPAIPPPPPLPGDLLPPLPGDLPVSPGDLLPPAPEDLEPLPPPPDVPEFGDTALPVPPAVPELGDTALPPPPAPEEPRWAPESYLEKVVALYPYERQKDNELSLEPGELLWVTRRLPDGWCEGLRGEESGIFPGNYVEP